MRVICHSEEGETRRRIRTIPGHKRRMPDVKRRLAFQKTAATYSPTWWGSTIGDGELNFSVRNGKRWFLTAITAAVSYLREQTSRFR